jgi:hypothetical protein
MVGWKGATFTITQLRDSLVLGDENWARAFVELEMGARL